MSEKSQIDRLQINGVFKSRRWLFEECPEKGQEILQNARKNHSPVFCICHGERHPLQMSVVLRETRFHLRRFRDQGSTHHPQCVSYGGINEHAQSLYTSEALREDGDKVLIRLNVSMSEIKNEKFRLEAGDPYESATPGQRRSSMSQLGLLNYLWEEANLNVWWPNMQGKRSMPVVRSRLLDVAHDRVLGKDLDLGRLLFIPRIAPRGEIVNNAADLKAHLERVAGLRGERESCYGMVVGEINKLIEPTAEKPSAGVVLNQLFTTPLWDNHGVLRRLDKSFPHQIERLRARTRAKEHHRAANSVAGAGDKPPPRKLTLDDLPNDYTLFGIFAVGLSKSGSFVLKHAAVMETSRRYIPIASHYEGLVERKLFNEMRAFEKPLVYDGERAFFPDFCLLDTGSEKRPVLEVYGYSGDVYEDRKRLKHVEYVRQGIPYWYWDIKQSPHTIPDFDAFPKHSRFLSTKSV